MTRVLAGVLVVPQLPLDLAHPRQQAPWDLPPGPRLGRLPLRVRHHAPELDEIEQLAVTADSLLPIEN